MTVRGLNGRSDIILASMTKQITARFENGVLRPEHPVDLPEGEQLHLIVITRTAGLPNGNAAKVLAEIAALPLEGDTILRH